MGADDPRHDVPKTQPTHQSKNPGTAEPLIQFFYPLSSRFPAAPPGKKMFFLVESPVAKILINHFGLRITHA
jgi:hypothetical protein